MKRFYIICAAFLLLGSLFSNQIMAQGRIELSRTNSVRQCDNATQNGFTASYSFSAIESRDYESKQGTFSWITMPNTVMGGNEGDPQIPVVNELIAVPFGARPHIEITSYSTTDYNLSDYGIKTVVPRQPVVWKNQKPEDVPFVYNKDAYQKRGFRTEPETRLSIDGTMRGVQIGRMTIEPVSYDPVSNKIRVFNNIEVKVTFDGANTKATEDMLVNTYSPYFTGLYEQLFNGRAVRDVYSDHPDLYTTPVKMLVIANRMFENCIQDWVAWKTTKGIYVDVNYTDDIGTSADAIKSFIQAKYAADHPTFLMIMGDKDQVAPSVASASNTNCVSDLYYSSVDGDEFVDMFHSRLSATSTSEMTAMLNKGLEYEQYTMPDPSYLSKTLLIAGADSGYGVEVGRPTIWYATNYYYNAEHGFTNVYEFSHGDYTNCYSYLSSGVGFANYTAHGSQTSWADPSFSVSDVSSLTNEHMYFLAMGNCCQSGDWGYGTCFGESLTRAANKGAYAYIGSCPNTTWYNDYYFGVGPTSRHDGTMPTMAETGMGCYDAIWMNDAYNTVNSILYVGLLAGNAAQALGYTMHSATLYYWQAYHVLGDGSIMPYRVQPTANDVSHMPILPMGMATYEVSAVPGSYVAISKDGVLLGTALVDDSGVANVTITPVTSGGDVTICVTAPQRIPYIATVPAAALEGAYVTVDSYNPTTAMVGEQTTMSIVFKNVGTDATNGTTSVTLSCEDNRLNFQTAALNFQNLAADATTTVNGFVYQIAEGVADGTVFTINYSATCGGETWEGRFNVTASAPNLVITDFTTTELMPGQSGTLSFTITNNGSAAAQNAHFQVSCNAPGVGLTNNTFNIGTLAAGASTTKTVNISIASSVSYGTSFNLNYTLTATHFSATGTQGIVAGIITEGFESGDFTAMEWELAGSANWTVDNAEHYAGSKSAKSGAITHSEQSDLSVNVTVLSAGNISFYYKVSSESNYDKLHFYIDGAEQGVWSGTVDWTQASYAVTPGEHTFKWSYTKDVSVNSGSDCAWIDEVEFPPIMVNAAPEPGLMGDVNLDESLNISDVIILLRHVMGGVSLSDEALALADVNNDGTVNINDVIVLLRQIMN